MYPKPDIVGERGGIVISRKLRVMKMWLLLGSCGWNSVIQGHHMSLSVWMWAFLLFVAFRMPQASDMTSVVQSEP